MKDEIKICDFGAAAVLSSTETITNEFKNEMIGTPPFLAPEVILLQFFYFLQIIIQCKNHPRMFNLC